MNQHAEAEEYDEQDQRQPGLLGRLFGRLTGHDGYPDPEEGGDSSEDDGQAAPPPPSARASGGSAVPPRRSAPALRLDHARRTRITVRRAVRGFEDAQFAADGLKDGQQQIVNLEQTPEEMAERIIDFLNGATYALEGSVERIGEQVFLFTPPSVTIEIQDKPVGNSRVVYVDPAGA